MEPGILIASPQMKDPWFEGTVVLLCHHDAGGALGVVINRTTDLALADVAGQLELQVPVDPARRVHWGGPVEPGAGFVVCRGAVDEGEGWAVGHDLVVTPSRDRLRQALEGDGPFLLCLGYAGWGSGQLDGEIEQGSWLFIEVDPRIVLELPPEERYAAALAHLGLQASQVWMQPVNE